MDEFEKIQKLIRLKKYESPGEEFVDEFVSKFRERQREEMLKQPVLTLFWEQVKMYFSESPGQKWALATAAIAVLALGAWLMVPHGDGGAGFAGRGAQGMPVTVSFATDSTGKSLQAFSVETIRIMGVIDVEEDPGLLSKHFTGGYEQFVIVPQEKSGSSIAVPYEFVDFGSKPDIR